MNWEYTEKHVDAIRRCEDSDLLEAMEIKTIREIHQTYEIEKLKIELSRSEQIVKIMSEFIEEIADDLYQVDFNFDVHSVEYDVMAIRKSINRFNPETILANRELS